MKSPCKEAARDMKGYVHVYTGDGKGKTTAALGLVLRACGAGCRAYIGQFLKGRPTCEKTILHERFPEVRFEQFGDVHFVRGKPAAKDIARARRCFRQLCEVVFSGEYHLVVADEIHAAVELGMVTVEDVLELIKRKPAHVELVLTGRNAHRRIIRRADLVTRMHAVKHYYNKGVPARRGIEM
jgi:cob(I)alamin adenosyltransferase